MIPQTIMIQVPDWDTYQMKLISSWYRLRKQGKLYPILQAGYSIYTFTNPCDPWNSREVLAWDQLERDVMEAEGRKPAQSERNHYTEERIKA